MKTAPVTTWLWLALAALLGAAAPLPAQAPTGLYAQLVYPDGSAPELRTFPIGYSAYWNRPERYRANLWEHLGSNDPLCLDIEKEQNAENLHVWGSRDQDGDRYEAAHEYLRSRLEVAAKLPEPVALWDRPSHNGMAHVWRIKELQERLASRYDDAAELIALQDFTTIALYVPKTHQPHEAKGWPLTQWIERGRFLARFAKRRTGKPVVLYLSHLYGGNGDDLPVGWTTAAVRSLQGEADAIVIWAFSKRAWGGPVCDEVGALFEGED